jgi:outer membrane protein
LSKEMQVKRENEIYEKEKAVQELKRKYFGKDGELFKKRESLMKPIQDEVYNAVKSVADENSYQLVLDKSSAVSIVYAVAKIDISDEVLTKLGYAK